MRDKLYHHNIGIMGGRVRISPGASWDGFSEGYELTVTHRMYRNVRTICFLCHVWWLYLWSLYITVTQDLKLGSTVTQLSIHVGGDVFQLFGFTSFLFIKFNQQESLAPNVCASLLEKRNQTPSGTPVLSKWNPAAAVTERPSNTWYVHIRGMFACSDCAVQTLNEARVQPSPTQWTSHFSALALKHAPQLTQRTIHFIPQFDRKQLKISHLCCNCYIAIFIVGTVSG